MRVCSSIPADRSAALTSQPTGTLPALRDGTTPSSLSRTRERNSPRKRNANAKHKRKRSFTPRVKSYRVETLFHRVRTTSEEHTGWLLSPKLESSPSTFDPNRFVSLAAVAPRRLSRVAFHAYLDHPSHRFSRASSKHLARDRPASVRPRRTDDRKKSHPPPSWFRFHHGHSDIRKFLMDRLDTLFAKTLKKNTTDES